MTDESADVEGQTPVEQALAGGEPQPVGWFRFYFTDERWEWSPQVERMHGYEPGTVQPTTDLVLSHKYPTTTDRWPRRWTRSSEPRVRSPPGTGSSTSALTCTTSSWSPTNSTATAETSSGRTASTSMSPSRRSSAASRDKMVTDAVAEVAIPGDQHQAARARRANRQGLSRTHPRRRTAGAFDVRPATAGCASAHPRLTFIRGTAGEFETDSGVSRLLGESVLLAGGLRAFVRTHQTSQSGRPSWPRQVAGWLLLTLTLLTWAPACPR